MSDTVLHLANKAKNIKSTPAYQPYSKVVIIVGNDENGNQLVYQAGNDSARTLEITNPYGTQQMANDILARLSGYQYQPFQADGALLNPAAELGDGITFADGTYSFISSTETTLSPIMSANVAAYEDGELNHEYPYETRENKEIARKINGIRTDFIVELGRVESTIEDMDAGYSSRFTQLSNSITAEVTARTNADSQMSSRITQNANSITSEVNARTSADNSLSSRITQNANSITSEVNARTSADNNLSSRITQNANSITSEVTRATTAEGDLNSRITQTANQITAQVNGIYAPEWRTSVRYYPNDVVKVTDGANVYYYKCTTQNVSSNSNKPPSSYWASISAPNVSSIVDIGLDGITLGYQSSNLENSATITLNRNGIQMDAQTITMTNVVANTIAASASIRSPTIYSWDYSTWMQLGTKDGHYGLELRTGNSSAYRVWGVYDGDFGYATYNSKGFDYMLTDAGINRVYCYGTWDFSGATVVGLPTNS